jgi:hypothetical protein
MQSYSPGKNNGVELIVRGHVIKNKTLNIEKCTFGYVLKIEPPIDKKIDREIQCNRAYIRGV